MPYQKYDADEMILRDHLAYDRTLLAVERTMLAYLRTAIAFFAGGVTLLALLSDYLWAVISGVGLLTCACLISAYGVRRFLHLRKKLKLGAAFEDLPTGQ